MVCWLNVSFERIKFSKKIPCNCKECKNDPDPYFFNLETLYRALDKRRYVIDCHKSFEDVNVRSLTAVVESDFFLGEDKEQIEQERFERLKEQHTEYFPTNQKAKTMSDSKYQINAQTVNMQVTENTQGGDAIFNQYANDPEVKANIEPLVNFVKEGLQKHPNSQPEQAAEIINAEIVQVKQNKPQRWQQLKQQFRNLPKDLRNPERLKQASKEALIQLATDLTDNTVLNTFIAFLNGLSEEPD